MPPLSIMTIYTVASDPYFAVIVLLLYLGLVQKQADLLVLGLNNAGKSTFIYKLLYGHSPPCIGHVSNPQLWR